MPHGLAHTPIEARESLEVLQDLCLCHGHIQGQFCSQLSVCAKPSQASVMQSSSRLGTRSRLRLHLHLHRG